MTVAELQERMSEEEFREWRALDYARPIGDERLVRQLALVAYIFANVHRAKNQKPFELDEFDLYRYRRPLTRAEEEEQFRAAFYDAGLVVRKPPKG